MGVVPNEHAKPFTTMDVVLNVQEIPFATIGVELNVQEPPLTATDTAETVISLKSQKTKRSIRFRPNFVLATLLALDTLFVSKLD